MIQPSGLPLTLGTVVATPGALEALSHPDATPLPLLLVRHTSGDWGDLDDEDKAANDEALLTGARVFSAYMLDTGVKVWIITEADRSSTTVLLPSEY